MKHRTKLISWHHFRAMPWVGDKFGWGFCFELLEFVYADYQRTRAALALSREREARMREAAQSLLTKYVKSVRQGPLLDPEWEALRFAALSPSGPGTSLGQHGQLKMNTPNAPGGREERS